MSFKEFKPYPKYKDSEVEWLGEIPGHWRVKPFKACIDFQEGPGIMATDFHQEGIPLLRISGVQGRWATLDGCNYLDPIKVAKQWAHFRLCKDDLLISASASMGTCSEVSDDTAGSVAYTGLIRLRGRNNLMVKPYIRSLVVSSVFATQIELFKAGSAIQHFGPTHLGQMLVICPPIKEQQAIADQIESETSRIDSLIFEKERLISLLQEYRQALISQSVTKGLDLNVKMKDSGVKWLGEVPEHWEITKIKWHSHIYSGQDNRSEDGDYPLYGANGLIGATKSCLNKNDTVLIGRVGSAGCLNFATGKFGVSDNALIVDEDPDLSPKFLFYSLLNEDFSLDISTTAQPLITSSQVKDHKIGLPPLIEQKEISSFLDRETSRIDSLISETLKFIDLLKEYRSAVITAAVTGKIDLREVVPSGSEKQEIAHE